MRAGYCIDSGAEYYCSDECLCQNYTPGQYESMYDNGEGDSYWTEWEDPGTFDPERLPALGREWFTFDTQREAEAFREWVRSTPHPFGHAYHIAGPTWEANSFAVLVDAGPR
jgi:hypothetical protein